MKSRFTKFIEVLLKIAISTIIICGLLTLLLMFILAAAVFITCVIQEGGGIT